jgi:hypothetical protein
MSKEQVNMAQNKAQGKKGPQQNNQNPATTADNFDEFGVGITDLFDSATAFVFSKTAGLYLTRSLALVATYVGGLSYAKSIASGATDTAGVTLTGNLASAASAALATPGTGAIVTGVALSLVTTCIEVMPRQHIYFPNSAQAQAVQLGLNPVLQPRSVNTPTAKSSSYLPVINRQNLEAERWKGSAVFWVSCGVYVFDTVQAFSTAQMFSDTGTLNTFAVLMALFGVAGPELSLLLGSLFAWGRLNRRGQRLLNQLRREAIVAAEQQMGGSHFVGAEPIPPSGPIPTYHPLANQQAQQQSGVTVVYPDQATADRAVARAKAQAKAAGAGMTATDVTPGRAKRRLTRANQTQAGNAGLNPFGGDAA